MKFTPLSDEEAAAQSGDLWPPGTYDYEIREATEETSKAGNDMFKLEIWIFSKDGERKLLWDYLVASEKATWKIHQFAASCGLTEQYKTGALMVAEIVGRTGMCDVVTQKATDDFPAKNVIKGYVKAKDAPASSRPAQRQPVHAGGGGDDLNDDIPFAACWQ
jgi:hypothetical protein